MNAFKRNPPKIFFEYWGCRTRQPGRTWLIGPGAVLVLIQNAGFVRDNGTKYTKGVHRGRKPACKKLLGRLECIHAQYRHAVPYKGCSQGPKVGTYSDWGLSSVLVINKHLSHYAIQASSAHECIHVQYRHAMHMNAFMITFECIHNCVWMHSWGPSKCDVASSEGV